MTRWSYEYDGATLNNAYHYTVDIYGNVKENSMSRMETLQKQAEYIMEQITKEQEKIAKYGTDDFADGTVISFQYQFVPKGVWYSYAALKWNGLWNTTGPKSPKALTWSELIAWWEQGKRRKAYVMQRGEKL